MPLSDLFPHQIRQKISQNATHLAAVLDEDDEVISLAEACFTPGDTLWIEAENVLLGAENAITRAQGGTQADSHPGPSGRIPGAVVLLADGESLFSHEFSGTDAITGIRCKGDVEAWFGVKMSGDLIYIGESDPERNEFFFPFSEKTPSQGDTVEVVVWCFYESGVFHGCLI